MARTFEVSHAIPGKTLGHKSGNLVSSGRDKHQQYHKASEPLQ